MQGVGRETGVTEGLCSAWGPEDGNHVLSRLRLKRVGACQTPNPSAAPPALPVLVWGLVYLSLCTVCAGIGRRASGCQLEGGSEVTVASPVFTCVLKAGEEVGFAVSQTTCLVLLTR